MAIVITPPLPAQAAAGATSTTYLATYDLSEGQGTSIASMRISPPAGYTTVTGTVAPNNAQFNFRQMRANVLVVAIGSLVLAVGTNLVAETPVLVPITTQPILQPGDTIDVQMVQNGTGLVINVGLFVEIDFA